ncbi:unnamed protein product [Rhizophagus irregularis]|nr:unnamed protein product [Rhizophagus irregularis]
MKDVINVDKQNNRVAFKFFSSAVLTQYQKDGNIESERLVLFVYLFIFWLYIFDIDDNILSQNEIELLGCWPSDDDIDLNENDDNEHDNLELINNQNQIDNATSKVIRLSKLDENLKIFDTIQSNDDDKSNSEESENENKNNTIDDLCLNFIKATEILKSNTY